MVVICVSSLYTRITIARTTSLVGKICPLKAGDAIDDGGCLRALLVAKLNQDAFFSGRTILNTACALEEGKLVQDFKSLVLEHMGVKL